MLVDLCELGFERRARYRYFGFFGNEQALLTVRRYKNAGVAAEVCFAACRKRCRGRENERARRE